MAEESQDKDLQIAEEEQELPPAIEQKKRTGRLRTGFTTGTTAAAATKAALHALINQVTVDSVTVSLPKGSIANIPIAWTKKDDLLVTAAAIKDGGDDPDATHGAEICSSVSYSDHAGEVVIKGGIGVGHVTKPGLGLEIGAPAINPVPMKMIQQAVREVASEALRNKGFIVTVSVPKGEDIAKKTDNPRLGIIGGISILGTTGIVLPYSTASFAASIRQGIDVLLATGGDTTVLTTGSRSEDFAKTLFKSLPEQSFIKIGDFAGFSVLQCAKKNVPNVVVAGFIGKLTKIAMGVKQTHVAGSHVDLEFMAKLASECGASPEVVSDIQQANTARHVSEIVSRHGVKGFFEMISKNAHSQLSAYARGILHMEVILFEFDGSVLGRFAT